MFSLNQLGDRRTLLLLVDGTPEVVNDDHPNFDALLELAKDWFPDQVPTDEARNLLDVNTALDTRFKSVSDRVTVSNGAVYVDGDVVDTRLTQKILEFYRAGEDFAPLVNFLDKLLGNPNEHSRDQLYNWLEAHNFQLTRDGNFIAYKGVRADADGNYTSINTGPARVMAAGSDEFVEVNGYVPNAVGSTVAMPRSQVEHNPAVGCSVGLHAGTWEYASGFARGAVLTVEVNPRDVVSVPTDCGHQKLRTASYVVLNVTDKEHTGLMWDDDGTEDESFDFDDDVDPWEEDFAPEPYTNIYNWAWR